MATRKFFGVLCLLSACAFAQIPAGDACGSATPVFDGVNPGAPSGSSGLFFTNVGATPGLSGLPDVWFSYTATGSGTVTFSTCDPVGLPPGTATVRALELYAGCGLFPLLIIERACGNGAAFSFVAVAGQTYLVRVYNANDGSNVTPGTFYVTIAYDGPAQTGTCAGAPALPAIPFGVDFDPIPATGDASPPTCVPAGSGTAWSQAWFTIAPVAANTLSVRSNVVASSLPGAGGYVGENTLAVFDVSAGCASPVAVACSPDGYLQCALSAGSSYALRVTFVAGVSLGRRSLVSARLDPLLAGDVCATAPPLALALVNNGVVSFVDFFGATPEPGASADLCASGPAGVDYWRTLTLPFNCVVSISWVYTSPYGTSVAVFPAGCASGPPLVCLTHGPPPWPSVSFTGLAGQTYDFRFARTSLGATTAYGAIALFCSPTPSNDACAAAAVVPFGDFAGAMLGATPSAPLGSACAASYASYPDVWYSFTATDSSTHQLLATANDPAGSIAIGVGVEVFAACGGASLVCAPPGPGVITTAPFTTVAGASYVVRIFAANSLSATWTFSLQFLPTSPNDGPPNAIELFDGLNPSPPAGQVGQFYSMAYATNSSVPAAFCPGTTTPAALGSVDVWLRYTATSSEPRAISLCTPPGFPAASTADLALRVYDGLPPAGTLTACADNECGQLPRTAIAPVPGTTYYLVVEQKGVVTPGPGVAGFYVRVDQPATQAPAGAGCTTFVPPLTASAPLLTGTPTLTLSALGGDAAWIFGSADLGASLDLGSIQPGCVVHLDSTTLFEAATFTVPGLFPFPTTTTIGFPNLPAWLVGTSLLFQAAVVPGPNSFNTSNPATLRLSNAVRVTFGY
jgi:hypothetical protein